MYVKNMVFTYVNNNEGMQRQTTLSHLTVNMSGLTLDSVNTFGVQLKRLRINTPDSLYNINMNGIKLSVKQRELLVDKTEIKPRLSIDAFYRAVRYDKDRFNMVFNGMKMSHIDINRFLDKQEVHVGRMSIASSWGEIYNNYNWPRRVPPIRIRKNPQEQLQKLAFDITIDTMLMHNGTMSYKMATKKSGEVANFFMTQGENTFYNITNNAAAKRKNPYATGIMYSRAMGAGNMNSFFKFNLVAKNGAFSYTIRMGKMNGKALNPLSVPLALMRIDSADIDHMLLQANANDKQAIGHLDLYYRNMKVSVLKRDKEHDTLKKKKVLSFFTNVFLPNDNPKKNGKFRKGPINVTRSARMSFLGFMYKSALDGATSAMSGLDQHKDRPDNNMAVSLGSKIMKPQKMVKKKHR
jgi:hypothetical protein